MTISLGNRAKMSTSTTGTGTITLGSAVSGFQTFADAGITNGQTVRYAIDDGANFEIGSGTYTSSGTTITRSVTESSNSDSAISLSGSAEVFIAATVADLYINDGASTLTTTGVITGGTLEATTDTAAGDNAAIGYTAAEGLILTGQGSTSDITLKNDADAVVFTVPTGTDDILFPDNAKIFMGASSDLSLYHDGSNSYLQELGTGYLVISSNGPGVRINSDTAEVMADFTPNGAATLYHNNAAKLATTATGIDVTGNATFADNGKAIFGAGSDLQIYHDGSNSYIKEDGTGVLKIQAADLELLHADGSRGIRVTNDGGPVLYNDGSSKLTVNSGGVAISGNITVTGTVDGRDIATNIPSSLGSAGQVLTVNGGASAAEWAAAGGASASADLYIANPSSATAPTAAGTNAVSIGSGSVASGEKGFALLGGTASGQYAMAFNNYAVASAEKSISLGWLTDATATSAVAIGTGTQSGGSHSVALGQSNAQGADSFAAAIGNASSSYGASGGSSVAMGSNAIASAYGAISLGKQNTASGTYSTIVGSYFSTVSANYSGVFSGRTNTCSNGTYATVVGGSTNEAQGQYSAVIGGFDTQATGKYSFASGGEAVSAEIGKVARASGKFAARGDAQGGQFVLRSDTTDATAEALTTNNSTANATNQIVAASDTCITFHGTVTAMQNGAQAYGGWEIKGMLVNDGGTTSLALGNVSDMAANNASSWAVALSADDTNNALKIQVTGEAAHNIRWVANVQTAEVTYA